jgi:hypothetical protein
MLKHKNFGNESYFKFSIIEGNPQMLPQIRIDDVEAEDCLDVTAIICPSLRASLEYADLGHVFGLFKSLLWMPVLTNMGLEHHSVGII